MKKIGLVWIFASILGSAPVFALQDCESGGKDINLNNGDSTRNLTGTVTCRDRDSKKIEREMRYVKGVETWQRYYYDNGKPKSERSINAQGNSEGRVKEFHENGKLKEDCEYVNGEAHGVCKHYFPSGKLERAAYRVKYGTQTELSYNEDGSLHALECSEGTFSKEDRELCGFNGKPSQVLLYWRDKNAKPYQKVSFLKGKVAALTKYDQEGHETWHTEGGLETTKWSNGKIKTEKRVADGELHGAQREFAESGQLTKESTYEKGFLKTEKSFYLNGQMKQLEEKKKEGERVATVSKEFWDNGQVQREGRYVDRRPTGVFKSYREDGSLAAEENYGDDGEPNGVSKFYFDDGKKLAREVAYEKGRMSRVKEYDESGKLQMHEEYFADGSKKAYKKRQ